MSHGGIASKEGSQKWEKKVQKKGRQSEIFGGGCKHLTTKNHNRGRRRGRQGWVGGDANSESQNEYRLKTREVQNCRISGGTSGRVKKKTRRGAFCFLPKMCGATF